MDLKDAEKQIDSADSFLTKLWNVLGKHWGKLVIIGLFYCLYKFVGLVYDEIENPTPIDPVVTEQHYIEYENGDSDLIRTWNTGIVDTIPVNY